MIAGGGAETGPGGPSDVLDIATALGLRRSGRHYRGACPVHGGGKAPFALSEGEGGRLLVHCHAGCAPRDILGEMRRRGLLAASHLREPMPIAKAPPPPRDWSPSAQRLWDQGAPIAGSLAATYLQARGCPIPDTEDLRCIAANVFGPFPAMLARITDAITARPISLHFTRLCADGTAKAAVAKPKLLLGGHRKAGGCIRLCSDDAVTFGLGLAEGIETALAVMAGGWAPVWATVDAGNMASFPVLGGIETLTLFADHDPAGIAAAERCAARWREAGKETRIVMPEERGTDWNEVSS